MRAGKNGEKIIQMKSLNYQNNVKLKNAFSEETRELFAFNYKCFWCGQNHYNCLHHILGRISNSPLNACPLGNFECHIGNGKLATFDAKRKLLKKTEEYLNDQEYVLTKEDKEFKKKYNKYYD